MSDDTDALIAQLQARLEALEGGQGGPDNILDVQRALVNHERAKRMAMMKKLEKDIRPTIARANGYNPDGDYIGTDYKPYPTWVHIKQPDGTTRSVVAQNKFEHDQLLGKKPEPAKIKTVEITEPEQAEPVKIRRGRPPKAKVELPQNLE